MRLYAEMGTPDQSVRQFHLCEDVLRRTLALAPQHETVSLYHDILANRIPERTRTAQRDREPEGSWQPEIAKPALGRPFVGRERALAHLSEQLSRRAEGAGMILLNGEAGVGKTRLLEELATRARRQGVAVLWGGSGAPANHFAAGPFAVALEGYAASRPETERSELAHRYPALARFVPSIRASSQPQPAAPEPYGHLDLIPAIVRLLTDLGRSQRVLLVLGDLHDFDPYSLELLRYLAQLAVRRPWLLIGAVREEEVETGTELRRVIDATIRARLCQRLDLQSLSRSDCDQLVRAMLPGGRARSELLQQIYTRSGGNPLFVEELVGELHESSELTVTNGNRHEASWVPSRVPARVRYLVMTRLAHMDETMRRVLGLAAAASATEISLSELRAGAATLEPPISDASLFDALDAALQQRILEERNSGYAFRHPLLRAALYQELPRHRRDQLHAALAVNGRSLAFGSARSEVVVEGEDHGSRAVAEVQLGEDVVDVGLDGPGAHDELVRDLVVRPPASDEGQHLPLPDGERGEGVIVARRRRRRIAIDGQDAAGHARVEPGPALGDGANGVLEVDRWNPLEHEARRAGPEHAGERLVVVEGGEGEHRGSAGLAEQPPGRRDAVDNRHPNVHQDHVGPRGLDRGGQLAAVGALANDLEAEPLTQDPA
jgi:hypothetical protein